MNAKKFALIGGSVMLGLGVISLIPGVYQNFSENAVSLPPLNVETSYGLTFGFLPMNVFNKIALILFGVAGIAASRERGPIPEGVTRTAPNGTTTVGGNGWSTPIVAEPISGAILWSRVVAVMMGTLAILGLIPSTQTLYGTWPLFGAEALAHGIFAILGTFFGFRNRRAKYSTLAPITSPNAARNHAA